MNDLRTACAQAWERDAKAREALAARLGQPRESAPVPSAGQRLVALRLSMFQLEWRFA